MDCFLGVDIGTSSCRVVILLDDLTIAGELRHDYDLECPRPGQAEQDVEEITRIVLELIEQGLSRCRSRGFTVRALGIAAAICNMVCLDKDGRPLMKAWTWADLRSHKQAEYLKATYGRKFYFRTGCPFHPMYWPARLLYIKENLPEVFKNTRYIVSLKDYIIYRLTGRRVADLSLASATGLLNIHTLGWDDELLRVLGVAPEMLWEPVEPTAVIGRLDRGGEGGDGAGPLLVAGASDGALSNVGCGALAPGVMALMIGSSGAMRVATAAPLLSSDNATWCYYLGDQLRLTGGSTNNGGNVLKWFRHNIMDDRLDYQTMSTLAATVPPGCEGLFFLPFLAGERCPHWRSGARGVFHGLTLTHTKAHVVRAMMEGVAFQMYSVFTSLQKLVGPPGEIRVGGGVVQSPVWLGILADLFDQPLLIPRYNEGSAVGAAILSMRARYEQKTLADIGRLVPIERIIEPDEERAQQYRRLYQKYGLLYEILVPDRMGG